MEIRLILRINLLLKMKLFWTVLVGFLIYSCNTSTDKTSISIKEDLEIKKPTTEFQFSDFTIMKGQLGPIKVGMTIEETENQFNGLIKKEDEAVNFGFGGGSPAYLYYLRDDILFGLIPRLGTDTVLFIIAAHRELQTTNSLNPNSTVKELIEQYPGMKVSRDLMNDWEYFRDTINDWQFIFMTDAKTKIGEYPEPSFDNEIPSKPIRLTTKTDWITIQ